MATNDLTALSPAAERLKQLQAESERLPFEEIAAFLRASQYDVLERTGNDEATNQRLGYANVNEDGFRLSHDWTEKGVRHQWALSKLSVFLEIEDGEGRVRVEHADDAAEAVRERATRELTNVRKILVEIDHLAHDGQERRDPAVTLAVIERLAGEGQGLLYGRLWDDLTQALERS